MKRLIGILVALLLATVVPLYGADGEPYYSNIKPEAFTPTDGPLTPIMSLRGRTDENGYVRVVLAAAGLTDGPLTAFGNLRARTNEDGHLLVSCVGCDAVSAAPVDATYITQTANATLTNEQALGALATGILKNTTTTGVLSIATAGTDYQASAFTSLPVSGQTTVTASGSTALTMVAGSGVTLTTDNTAKSVTIAASGGGGGTPAGSVGAIQFHDTGDVFGGFGSWDGTTFGLNKGAAFTPSYGFTAYPFAGTWLDDSSMVLGPAITLGLIDALPPDAVATVALGSSGAVTNGTHEIYYAFDQPKSTTTPFLIGTIEVTDNKEIELSDLQLGNDATIFRFIYMTPAGETGVENALGAGTISNNTDTTFTIVLADGSLGGANPNPNIPPDYLAGVPVAPLRFTAMIDSLYEGFPQPLAAIQAKFTETTGWVRLVGGAYTVEGYEAIAIGDNTFGKILLDLNNNKEIIPSSAFKIGSVSSPFGNAFLGAVSSSGAITATDFKIGSDSIGDLFAALDSSPSFSGSVQATDFIISDTGAFQIPALACPSGQTATVTWTVNDAGALVPAKGSCS